MFQFKTLCLLILKYPRRPFNSFSLNSIGYFTQKQILNIFFSIVALCLNLLFTYFDETTSIIDNCVYIYIYWNIEHVPCIVHIHINCMQLAVLVFFNFHDIETKTLDVCLIRSNVLSIFACLVGLNRPFVCVFAFRRMPNFLERYIRVIHLWINFKTKISCCFFTIFTQKK